MDSRVSMDFNHFIYIYIYIYIYIICLFIAAFFVSTNIDVLGPLLGSRGLGGEQWWDADLR